jgi:hypothetical protein
MNALLKEFKSAPDMGPELIGGVGQGGPTDEFVARFGTKWRRTKSAGECRCWWIGDDKHQFTCVRLRGGLDIAAYSFPSLKAFQEAFDNKEHGNEVDAYFQTKPGDKYSAVAIMRYLHDVATGA